MVQELETIVQENMQKGSLGRFKDRVSNWFSRAHTRVAYATALLAAIGVLYTAQPARADLIHTRPDAVKVFEDNFDDGNYDGWLPFANSLINAQNGYLNLSRTELGLYPKVEYSINLPVDFEIQCKISNRIDIPAVGYTVAALGDFMNWFFLDIDTSTNDPRQGTVTLYTSSGQQYFQNIALNEGVWDEWSLISYNNIAELYLNGVLLGTSPRDSNSINRDILFEINASNNLMASVGIDDVTVWTTPEPATFTILGLGALGLLTKRRQNKTEVSR